MKASSALALFQERCHHYFTCFTFATMGLQNIADRLKPNVSKNKNPRLFIGSGHPDRGQTHSKIPLKDAVRFSGKNGVFSDMIAKSVIVSIYSEWDELYRHKVAEEVGTDAKNVLCDLMGDLRFIRRWIVHKKSIIDNDRSKMKILRWQLREGDELRVSDQMFSNLIDEINAMRVEIRAT